MDYRTMDYRYGLVRSFLGFALLSLGCASPTTAHTDAGPSSGSDAGLGDPSLSTSAYDNGTRLRAQSYDLSGTKVFDSFFDTARGETCRYLLSDGEQRCLPHTWGSIFYADSNCTVAVVVKNQFSCVEQKYGGAYTFSAGTCSSPTLELRPLDGTTIVGTAYRRTQDANGVPSCEPLGNPEGPLLVAGAPIPLSEFVRGTEVQVPLSAELALTKLIGEDGSGFAIGFFDRQRERYCSGRDLGGADTIDNRCVPEAAFGITSYGPYADSSCTELGGRELACQTPHGVLVSEDRRVNGAPFLDGTKSFLYSFFELGTLLSAAYTSSGDSCNLYSGPAYALGAPVAPAALPSISYASSGSGRLRLLSNGLGYSQDIWDEQEQARCEPQRFTDGKTYCVPRSTLFFREFFDETCKPTYFSTSVDLGVTLAPADACGTIFSTTVQPLGPPRQVANVYFDASCAQLVNNGYGVGYSYEPAIEVSTRYAPLELATE